MKKIILASAAIVALSSLGFAAENREGNKEDGGFYLGLAYSHLSHDIDYERLTTNVELDFNAIMLQAGYKFNPYVAVEGRYNVSFSDTDLDDHMDNADGSVLSLFVKPMYPIAPEMDIYALLGYSLTDASNDLSITSVDEGAFSWGLGALYDITEEFNIFADYTRFYDDRLTGFDHVVDSFNIGVNYKF